MKKLTILFAMTIFAYNLSAEIIHFRAPALVGKINSELIDLTDWQAVMTCHYLLGGKNQEVMKYPLTLLKKIDVSNYSVSIKAMSLFEALPNLDLQNCAYKMILIGKNKTTHQTAFGEIFLIGTDRGKMTEKELEIIQNKDQLAKILNEKIKDISITYGNEGGIILNKNTDE
jgi:hypothetical protein